MNGRRIIANTLILAPLYFILGLLLPTAGVEVGTWEYYALLVGLPFSLLAGVEHLILSYRDEALDKIVKKYSKEN